MKRQIRRAVCLAGIICVVAASLCGCQKGVSTQELDQLGFVRPDKEEQLLAFPGADGWGKYTKGGRGGTVIEVTNLNDSGEGSLRAAVEAKGPRTVIFRVSGVIELSDFLRIKEPYITIAGQTAPGDGICLKNFGLIVETEEAIVRYLHSRPGDGGGETDALWVNEAKQVVIDHVSTSWGTDETLSVSDSDKVSVQWCLISESLNHSVHSKGVHGMGSLVRGSRGQQVTFHDNLYISHRNRNPMCGNYSDVSEDPTGFRFEFINNVVYNWGARAAGKCHDLNTVTYYNFISNYYLPGPKSGGEYMFSEGCALNKMYAAGNAMNGEVPQDQWSLFEIESEDEGMQAFDWETYKQTEAFPSIMTGTVSAKDAYERVLEGAGASLNRDAVDEAVIQTLLDNKGRMIDRIDQSAAYSEEWPDGYPVYEQTTPITDQDKDGMDDAWETEHGLNPKDGTDGAKESSYGYTNLEVYLQSLVVN